MPPTIIIPTPFSTRVFSADAAQPDAAAQARVVVGYVTIILASTLALVLILARIRYLRNNSRPLTSFFTFSPSLPSYLSRSPPRSPLSSPLSSPPLPPSQSVFVLPSSSSYDTQACATPERNRNARYPRTHGLPVHLLYPHPNLPPHSHSQSDTTECTHTPILPQRTTRFILPLDHLYSADLFPAVPPGVIPSRQQQQEEREKEQLPAYDPQKLPAYSELNLVLPRFDSGSGPDSVSHSGSGSGSGSRDIICDTGAPGTPSPDDNSDHSTANPDVRLELSEEEEEDMTITALALAYIESDSTDSTTDPTLPLPLHTPSTSDNSKN